jgi:hypothetical protein
MKLLISSLASVILAHGSLVNAYSYNGYVNRQLEKAPGNLFRNRLAKYQKNNAAGEDSGRLRRHRRTEGEVPVPPEMTGVPMPPEVTDDALVEPETREQQSHYQVRITTFFLVNCPVCLKCRNIFTFFVRLRLLTISRKELTLSSLSGLTQMRLLLEPLHVVS